jgi:AcrR family transcriptional regulator
MRDRILGAAARVFSQKGYHKAGMDEIAIEAAVAKGSLYYHFKSKSGLFCHVAVSGMQELRCEVRQAVELPVSIEEKVAAAIDRISAICFDYPEMFNIVMSQSPEGIEPESWQQIQQERAGLIQYIAGLLKEGSDAEGVIRPMDYSLVTGALMSFINAYRPDTPLCDALQRDRLRAEIREVVMHGVMV